MGPPTPELDDAWTSLIEKEVDAFSISDELFREVNASPETGVKVHRPGDAEGEGHYLATFDVVHKLHCVVKLTSLALSILATVNEMQNLLRKSLHRDQYPDYIAFSSGSEDVIKGHQG